MTTIGTLIVLFCIATAVAIAARPLRVPYTVALVIVGLVLGQLHVVAPPHLTRELLFAVFLPGLLFEAAFNIDAVVFRRMWIAVTALAIPGVIVGIAWTAFVMIAALHGFDIVPEFSWGAALVFAAIVGATDPVAVTALFRQLRVPAGLTVLVEGESLFNDGTAVVFLSLILAYVSGTPTSVVKLIGEFVTVAGGGTFTGLVVGVAATQLIRRIDDPMIEIAITTIVAYGSFILAEDLHVSGVIATVVAGMVCGNYGRRVGMSDMTRVAVESFWEYLAFALNSVVFLLIGFEVSVSSLIASWREILIAYIAVLTARTVIVFGGRYIWRGIRRGGEAGMAFGWSAVLVWGGLRGALSMVLALALPPGLTDRDVVVTMTAGVVLLTLLVQGLTMAPLLRRSGFHSENAFTNARVSAHGAAV